MAFPIALKSAAAVGFDGEVFVLGGQANGGQVLRTMKSLRAGGVAWTDHPDVPADVGRTEAVVVDGKIYVRARDNRIYSYDLNRRSWDAASIMLPVVGSGSGAIAVADGCLHSVVEDLTSVKIYRHDTACGSSVGGSDAGSSDAGIEDATATDSGPSVDAGGTADAGIADSGPPPGYVVIPSGTFTMGSPTAELGRQSDEVEHAVTLTRAFYMKATEVTLGEWRSLMGNSPKSACDPNCPARSLSWFDAVAYANAASAADGLPECYTLSGCTGTAGMGMSCSSVTFSGIDCTGYRLPTEAEWEYAARAGTTTAFYTGAITSANGSDPNLDMAGWYNGNSGDMAHPVAQKQPNAFGLYYDMHGNEREWVHDWYAAYSTAPVTDPTGPSTGTSRVTRGGSCCGQASVCRSAHRLTDGPASRRGGLRLVRTVP